MTTAPRTCSRSWHVRIGTSTTRGSISGSSRVCIFGGRTGKGGENGVPLDIRTTTRGRDHPSFCVRQQPSAWRPLYGRGAVLSTHLVYACVVRARYHVELNASTDVTAPHLQHDRTGAA